MATRYLGATAVPEGSAQRTDLRFYTLSSQPSYNPITEHSLLSSPASPQIRCSGEPYTLMDDALVGNSPHHITPSMQTDAEEPIAPVEELANSVLSSLQHVKAQLLEAEAIVTHKTFKFERGSQHRRSFSNASTILDRAAEQVNILLAAEAAEDSRNHIASLWHIHLLQLTVSRFSGTFESSDDSPFRLFMSEVSRWCALVEELLDTQRANDSGTSMANTSDVQLLIVDEDQCELTQSIPMHMMIISPHPPLCKLPDFATFLSSTMSSQSERQIGAVRSFHLFRSRKAPFYHEYIVISFGSAPALSWLRLERAARVKRGRFLRPQKDSSGPLARGVVVRESSSFSSRLSRLSNNSDEWASVSITPSNSERLGPRIFIRELMQQIVHTSLTNPDYQLFTANCRWFARRSFVNIMRWCQSAQITHSASWKGSPVAFDKLQKKLEAEWFGGSQIHNLWAKGLDQRNAINMAIARGGFGDTPISREYFDDLIRGVETAELDPGQRGQLLADLLIKRSMIRRAVGNHESALVDTERAISIYGAMSASTRSGMRQELINALLARSSALRDLGRAADAVSASEEAIAVGIEFAKPDAAMFHCLLEQGLNLRAAGRFTDAITPLQSALSIVKAITPTGPPNTRIEDRAEVFRVYAPLLHDVLRFRDALEAQKELISALQGLHLLSPDDRKLSNELLAARLRLSGYASDAGEHIQALQAARDAVTTCRAFCGPDEELGEQMPLCVGLLAHARLLKNNGRLEDACRAQSEVAAIYRRASAQNLPDERRRFANILFIQSRYLYEAGHPAETLGCVREASDIIQTELKEALHSFAEDHKTLETFTGLEFEILSAQDRLDDITVLLEQRVELFRDISATSNDSSDVHSALAASLEHLGLHLAQIGPIEHSIEAIQEATSIYRSAAGEDVGVSPSLCNCLRRFSTVLSLHGRHEEALNTVAEAVLLARTIVEHAIDGQAAQDLLDSCIETENMCRQRAFGETEAGAKSTPKSD